MNKTIARTSIAIFLAMLVPCLAAAQEICDNGIDDDGNGLVDLNDTLPCPCNIVLPGPQLLANASFEDHTCCPEEASHATDQILDCAGPWTDHSTTSTADYMNTCGFVGGAMPQPVPDGQGLLGIGMVTTPSFTSYEFFGQCLADPLLAGGSYQFGFQVAAARVHLNLDQGLSTAYPIDFGPIDLTVYGLGTCPTLPYDDASFTCIADRGWTVLGQAHYTPVQAWQQINFTFDAPFDVQAIMFGPPCNIPPDYNMWHESNAYFFFDDFSLTSTELAVTATGHPCAMAHGFLPSADHLRGPLQQRRGAVALEFPTGRSPHQHDAAPAKHLPG